MYGTSFELLVSLTSLLQHLFPTTYFQLTSKSEKKESEGSVYCNIIISREGIKKKRYSTKKALNCYSRNIYAFSPGQYSSQNFN